eukprot:CAMPEP_0172497336 /NCGR_PEP_ID=MMETSP1066-20121228/98365_1 /TAXON_ID=671091 /ORGANISM="Coscinodiscus wailesii, Strain CCMP2513" /LENGTH=244 /DNA_ID=CAMNT_0013270037 /DNA_START=46 /DNA_END=780 /DNA_ORIENTATION=+
MADEDANQEKPLMNENSRPNGGNRPVITLCSLPHGYIGIVAPMFAALAFLLAINATERCNFISVKTYAIVNNTITLRRSHSTGIWLTEGNNTICEPYPSNTPIDSKIVSSRVFSIMAPIIGGVGMIILCMSACVPMRAVIWNSTGVLLFLACFLQGLVLLIFSTDFCTIIRPGVYTSCAVSQGAAICISAMFFWFAAAIASMKYNPPDVKSLGKPIGAPTERTVTTEETRPDGTKIVTTTTTFD